MFSPKIRNKAKIITFPLLFKIYIGASLSAIMQENEIYDIQLERKK